MDGLVLSADNGDTTEPSRILQLAAIYSRLVIIGGKAEARCSATIGKAILRMHDRRGSLTVLWSCRDCAHAFSAMVDRMWGQLDHGPTTHVVAAERQVYAGTDPTWREWNFLFQDELYDMPSPSREVH